MDPTGECDRAARARISSFFLLGFSSPHHQQRHVVFKLLSCPFPHSIEDPSLNIHQRLPGTSVDFSLQAPVTKFFPALRSFGKPVRIQHEQVVWLKHHLTSLELRCSKHSKRKSPFRQLSPTA